jgi:hypothetical protein
MLNWNKTAAGGASDPYELIAPRFYETRRAIQSIPGQGPKLGHSEVRQVPFLLLPPSHNAGPPVLATAPH